MSENKKVLNFALPKGSLWENVSKLMTEAGYKIGDTSRSYRPSFNDKEISLKLLRPQEIPEYLSSDYNFDLGISGKDWCLENHADVETILDLQIGAVKIVFCVPTKWENVNSFDDMMELFGKEGKTFRISTEYINYSIDFIMKSAAYKKYYGDKKPMVYTPWQKWGENEKVKIYLSFGATEAKPPDEVDAIIDNTETGSTIIANSLKIVEVVDRSSALLIANKRALADPWKREKISDIKILLAGALIARQKIFIFMNAKKENVPEIMKLLPALKNPTISDLVGEGSEGWVALNTVLNKDEFLPLIPKLRKLAQGIVITEPRQVLPMDLAKLD